MSDQLKANLGRIWLLLSGVSLILPVFLPSSAHPQNFLQNVIGTTTVTMFILSFPSSLFGIPLFIFAQMALGFDPNTISGMYLNLFLMFVLGSVQWFWIVPRLAQRRRDLEILDLSLPGTAPQPVGEVTSACYEFFDERSRSPLERAISDEDRG